MIREIVLSALVLEAVSAFCVNRNGQTVNLGKSVKEGGYEFTCVQEANTNPYLKPTACVFQDRVIKLEQTTQDIYYVYKCTEINGGVLLEVIGCKDTYGNILSAGDKVEHGDFVWECTRDTYGDLVLSPTGCISDGIEIALDSNFTRGEFWYTCEVTPEGALVASLQGCLNNGQKVRPGHKFFNNGFVYRCSCSGNSCTHAVTGCADDSPNPEEKAIGSTWLQGRAPFQYRSTCKPCAKGTTITRTRPYCRYRNDILLDPGCMREIDRKVVACGINAEQGLQIYTEPMGGGSKFTRQGYRRC